jgi:hypothetical protein
MLKADLYLDRVDLRQYWPVDAPIGCEHFMRSYREGKKSPENYPFLSSKLLQSLRVVLEAETYLPSVPLLTVPQPIEPGLSELNEPGRDSLVIVSVNSRLTLEVLTTVWSQGLTPAYFLFVDCMGSTVDMSVIFGDFTSARLAQAVRSSGIEEMVDHRRMLVPGLTSSLVPEFSDRTGWEIEAGPVCAVELPLYLGERWISTAYNP